MSDNTASLIYIHGFTSSPQSQKAIATADYIQREQLPVNFICPQLSDHPVVAMNQLEELLRDYDTPPVLIGSSMGGFFASNLTERFDLASALINPAVAPARLIANQLGQNTLTLCNFVARMQR